MTEKRAEILNEQSPVMDSNVPIAVIGMSCRFPGDVNSPEDLWQLLADGRSGWSEIPTSRFHLDGVYHPNSSKVNTVRTNLMSVDCE